MLPEEGWPDECHSLFVSLHASELESIFAETGALCTETFESEPRGGFVVLRLCSDLSQGSIKENMSVWVVLPHITGNTYLFK